LDGINSANEKPIRIDTVPGSQWRYSAGGFLVVRQRMIDLPSGCIPRHRAFEQETGFVGL
jgi:hypothetical protein